jgi:hypothetical protein
MRMMDVRGYRDLTVVLFTRVDPRLGLLLMLPAGLWVVAWGAACGFGHLGATPPARAGCWAQIAQPTTNAVS